MEQITGTKEVAQMTNFLFEQEIYQFLHVWIQNHPDKTLLRFDQTLEEYLANDALRDFFLTTQHPVQKLLENKFIACHLARGADEVYFDPNGNPLLTITEQRIYNLARRMDSERMHVPFRSIHPNKQTDAGDAAEVDTYPVESEEVRYNSGNYFISRPANGNVFDENTNRCTSKSEGNLHVSFKRGFLEDRLRDLKELTAIMHKEGETQPQFFVIYSRHSVIESHFGTSLVIMDPINPDFPKRIMVCDTLLKELPQHPRWWNHFIAEFSHVFGDAIAEIVEDLSHPLQKVNIKGDAPYRHDWNCPYYAASMANALAELVKDKSEFILNGSLHDIHNAMKYKMQDYYQLDLSLKERSEIQNTNQLKRWKSGSFLIEDLAIEVSRKSSYEF
jgi:hypothetical protein